MAEREPTHYQQLGVSPFASASTIREAYLHLARLLHPDQLTAASAAEQRLAERRMREVNAAWAVLKDPERRKAYDRRLAELGRLRPDPPPQAPRAATFDAHRSEPTGDDELDEVDLADGGHLPLFVSRLPWLLLAAVAAAIFVFTAYAKTPVDPATTTTSPSATCVDPAPPGSC